MNTEERYKPYRKHPELFGDIFSKSWLHPDMIEIVDSMEKYNNGKSVDDDNENDSVPDVSEITSLLRVESYEVYSFNCLSATFLRLFNEELANFYEMSELHNMPVKRPNSMNNYGVIVNEIGMRPLITNFQQTYLWPMARILFPVEGEQFDDHHSFIVRYNADEDLGLDMHTDDSDVTFNVCLGDDDFTGATLVFCGRFGAHDHRRTSKTYEHQVGRAVIHLGSRRHGADDIASGTRANLIVWSHNWTYRSSYRYRSKMTTEVYEQESGPPDSMCLSYTHDRDYEYFKKLPKSQKDKQFHPWCPPSGKEYENFFQKNKSEDPQSQEDL